ncbi:MAG: hypothetical protein P1V51_23555 [Deltaproteobacteria bacterium]|nr:hypothetical protein [Deltaproteobacteria bacterium]
MAPDFLWSDSLVLASALIVHAGEPVALEAAIGEADELLGGTILSFQEMEGALARLGAAGHLRYEGGALVPGAESLAFFDGGPARLKRREEKLAEIEGFLRTGPFVKGTDPRRANEGVAPTPGFDRARFEAAVAAYLGGLHR